MHVFQNCFKQHCIRHFYGQKGIYSLLAKWGPAFGYEEVLEVENSIFKLEKPIIPQNKGLNKPVKMASLDFM